MNLVLLAVVAQLADLFAFAWMVDKRGIGHEANPFVIWLYGIDPSLIVVLKLAVIVLAIVAYLSLQEVRPMLALVVIWLTIFVGAIGALSNVLSRTT